MNNLVVISQLAAVRSGRASRVPGAGGGASLDSISDIILRYRLFFSL